MRLSGLCFGRRSFSSAALFVCLGLAGALFSEPAAANSKYAAMVVDHNTGKVLFSRYADAARFPASLTKIMTLYMLFDEMDAGRVKLSDRITMSRHAASMPPTKLGIKPGSTIRVEDAIRALVTKSANDVAAAIGEHIAGTEAAFARRMTRKAQSLGMNHTTFKNASGLPNGNQKTTARDMVTLSRAIIANHPRYYRYFSTRSFRYKGRAYRNHNRLLGSVKGVDGIKTGYTRASGFNLTTSVKRNNRHLVAVVMGGRTGKSRNQHMSSLISQFMGKAVATRRTPRVPPGVKVAARNVPVPPHRPRASGDPAQNDPIAAIVLADTTEIPVQPRPVRTTPIVIAAASAAPAPAAAPIPPEPLGQSDMGQGDISQPELEETLAVQSGWAIQIGAVGSATEAQTLIDKARAKAPRATASMVPFTESTVKNGETYVRARFAGYPSKGEARSACSVMKKRGFGCFAIAL